MTNSKFRVFFFVAGLATGLAACSETSDSGAGTGSTNDNGRGSRDVGNNTLDGTINSDTGGGTVDSGTTTPDAGSSTPDATVEFSCDSIPDNPEAGTVCTGAAGECAAGACITTQEGGDAVCSQICVPGQCEDFCVGDERCLSLIDQATGQPQTIPDTNLPLGVCGVPATGDAGAFSQCGGSMDACQSGLDCLILAEGDTMGQCFPQCNPDGSCAEGQCAIQTQGGDQYCVLTCTTAGGTGECPAEMACVAVTGGAICHYN